MLCLILMLGALDLGQADLRRSIPNIAVDATSLESRYRSGVCARHTYRHRRVLFEE
jgi:hypothetical protein